MDPGEERGAKAAASDWREALMEEIMGFWQIRVILTGAELDLFTLLDGAPSTAGRLAAAAGCDGRALERLCDALAALGFLEKAGDVFSVSGKGALLASGRPVSVLPMLLHFNELWSKWSGLTEVVRTGRPVEKAGGDAGEANRRAFIGAMHAIGLRLSTEIAAAFDASGFRCLLDIGGGSGVYTIAFLKRNPQMTAVLFDLPPVVGMAGQRIAAEGLARRVTLVSGDFYRDDLPSGCDLVLLSAIIHQNDAAGNVELYKKVFRALEPGGSLLIRDFVMDASRTTPVGGALFAVNMLVGTRGGGTYTFEEIRAGLEKAGFAGVERIRESDAMDSLIRAGKPR